MHAEKTTKMKRKILHAKKSNWFLLLTEIPAWIKHNWHRPTSNVLLCEINIQGDVLERHINTHHAATLVYTNLLSNQETSKVGSVLTRSWRDTLGLDCLEKTANRHTTENDDITNTRVHTVGNVTASIMPVNITAAGNTQVLIVMYCSRQISLPTATNNRSNIRDGSVNSSMFMLSYLGCAFILQLLQAVKPWLLVLVLASLA